jgi:hypothetical protein
MEWAIPLQKFEVGKVQIGELQNNDKLIVPLAYFDGQNIFNNLNIFLPKLKVQEFDIISGRFVLSLKENLYFEAKLNSLQTTLLGAIFIQQKVWFPSNFYNFDILQQYFRPIIENGFLHLYFPVQNYIKIYKNGIWYDEYQPGLIKPNDEVRVMFRIQGICFHKNNYNNIWSGKFRLQHKICAILIN